MLRSTSLSKTDLRKAHERRGVCHLAAFQCFPSLPGWPHAKPARLDFWADVKALPAISTTVPVPEQPGRDDSPAAVPVPERARRDDSPAAAITLHGTPAVVCYAARVGGSPVSCKSKRSGPVCGRGRVREREAAPILPAGSVRKKACNSARDRL